jgi:hypothetical protein
MTIPLRALAGTVVLTGALCLTATGTAQAVPGSFTCPSTSFHPAVGGLDTLGCLGGPYNADSGTVTNTTTQVRYRCGHLDVLPLGSFLYQVHGSLCTQL